MFCFHGFPDSSVGKESACNAGDSSSIPGSGRSAGEGMCYPLQYSWASLGAQLVKNPPAMWETWVQSLGWEDPLEKGKGYPLQYSGLENSMDHTVHGVTRSRTWLSDCPFHFASVIGCLSRYIVLDLCKQVDWSGWVLSPQNMPNFSFHGPFSEHGIDRKFMKPNIAPKNK